MAKLTVLFSFLFLCGVAHADAHYLTKDFNKLGVQLGVGVPDAAGLDLVYRPVKFLRMDLGGTTTLVGGGFHTGATIFVPWYISPSLTVEGGYQRAGNINRLVGMFGGSVNNVLLDDVNYGYANFHGGLEFGHPNWFMFFIHAGYSYIGLKTVGLQKFAEQQTDYVSVRVNEANVSAWVPTAKLGFLVWF